MLKEATKLFLTGKLIFLLAIGVSVWSLTMVKSGVLYSYGMGFWGPNGHDGIWHIALAQSLSRGSLEMPTFAGENLQNYHLGFDLLLALVHRLSGVPVVNLYFQIFPPILALLIGVLTYIFVFNWKKSKYQALWAVFFVYFGGSWGWLTGSGESAFWSQQAISTLINPPFALSLIFLLLGLIFLSKKRLIFAILFFGALVQIKAYAGVLALGGLFLVGTLEYLNYKNTNTLKVFFGSVIISIFLFLPLNRNSGGLLVWQPFWFLETMMGVDRFNWPRYYSAMMNYKLAGNLLKGIPAYFIAFIFFLLGNLGTRIIFIKYAKRIGNNEIFLLSSIILGVLIPLFFLQKGTPWNTIQFMYYSLFFSGILAGVVFGGFSEKTTKKRAVMFFAILVFLTIPTTIDTLKHYLPSRPPAMLSSEELNALRFLFKQENGVVLTYPFDKDKAEKAIDNPPRPLYLYEKTAYVSAFSSKPVFLEDEVNLDITGFNWKARLEKVEKFYKTKDASEAKTFLESNNILYIYLVKGQLLNLEAEQLSVEKIFENSEVDIYKVTK